MGHSLNFMDVHSLESISSQHYLLFKPACDKNLDDFNAFFTCNSIDVDNNIGALVTCCASRRGAQSQTRSNPLVSAFDLVGFRSVLKPY